MAEIVNNSRVDLDFSVTALLYRSISFLDTWQQREAGALDPTHIVEYNTWDNWHLIPSSNPIVAPAQVLTNYTDLPLWDGSIDETDILTGLASRQMISGSWEFLLEFDYIELFPNIYDLYTDLLESIHGKQKLIILNADQDNMYLGRVFIESFEDPADGNHTSVTIGYNIQPFVYDASNHCLLKYYNGSMHELTLVQHA